MPTVADAGLIVEELRNCLAVQLDEAETGYPAPQRVEVRPGATTVPNMGTAEDECKCGLAWVRLAGLEAGAEGTGDPVFLADGSLCGPDFWSLTVEVGVLRCPHIGDEVSGPTSMQHLHDARRQWADMAAMRRALSCCELGDVPLVFQVGEYTPIGPEGTCLGGTWAATLTLDACYEC